MLAVSVFWSELTTGTINDFPLTFWYTKFRVLFTGTVSRDGD
jgi:hypothetical protein